MGQCFRIEEFDADPTEVYVRSFAEKLKGKSQARKHDSYNVRDPTSSMF
jgi:hypothetical protein